VAFGQLSRATTVRPSGGCRDYRSLERWIDDSDSVGAVPGTASSAARANWILLCRDRARLESAQTLLEVHVGLRGRV
jgi:hypothetical protein